MILRSGRAKFRRKRVKYNDQREPVVYSAFGVNPFITCLHCCSDTSSPIYRRAWTDPRGTIRPHYYRKTRKTRSSFFSSLPRKLIWGCCTARCKGVFTSLQLCGGNGAPVLLWALEERRHVRQKFHYVTWIYLVASLMINLQIAKK